MNLIKTGLISIVLLITTATLFTRCKQEEKVDNTNAALALFNHDLDTLNYLVDSVFYVQVAGNDDVATLRSTFLTSRDAYKRIEFLVEFYMPETSRFVNGPPLPEIEVEEHEITEPHGFQVIEEILYPEYAESDKEHLLLEIKNLSIFIKKYNDFFGVKQITANHLLHALRMNVFRVIALGLSGFDTPLSKNGIVEAGTSFSTLNRYLNVFYAASKDEVLVNDLKNKIASASTYLIQQKDFDAFDRMYFIKKYANPIFRDMLTFQRSIGIEPLTYRQPFRGDAENIFDADNYDADAYAENGAFYATPEKVALGESLFFDPSLSKRKSRSCASCHKPSLAFTDGLAKNKNLSDDGLILRNTPTLLNAAFQNSQFYDMRSENLEGQSIDVIRHKDEMHGSVDDLIEYLRNDSTYQDLFDKAFPGSRGNIKAMHIQNAIAAYVRSLKSLDSKFDRHMKTDSSILSTDEIAGFNLFMGKAKCATCHFIPLFNGTIPPSFSKTESEVLGVPASKAKGAKVDPDEGRYTIHKMEPLRYAFKTPRCEMLRLQHHICTMVFISRWKK